jgi:hypothetical protein
MGEVALGFDVGGVFVLVEKSAEAIATADAELCDRAGVGNR